jgi:acyl-CoA reductase-like NAD-dependent aldehyde dehydrogenase
MFRICRSGRYLELCRGTFPTVAGGAHGRSNAAGGDVLLVKHSPNTQRSSLEFERVMLEAGFPEGVLQNLILKTEDIVNVINDGRVQAASVTGSVRAGSAVASEAGKVIKKTVLELGGSDAFHSA